MRFKPSLIIAIFAILSVASPGRAQDQQDDQKIIDDFVTTRGVSFEDPGKKKPPQPPRQSAQAGSRRNSSASAARPAAGSPAGGVVASKGKPSAKAPKNSSGQSKQERLPEDDDVRETEVGGAASDADYSTLKASATSGARRPIGLGYTLFLKERSGGLVAVDPSREFKSGDRIAVALETNTDGYLYIFHTENGKNPMMLFPNVQLDGGANEARAHVRETYPADVNYAFEFDANPATERLYIIVSRQPLAGVPAGDALAQFCRGKGDECYWRPAPAQWERIKSGATGGRVTEVKNVLLAQAQTPVQSTALTRGIKIKKDEPKPAVVRINDSADADVLVTTVELVHR